jgi:hypothetical protein
LQHLNSVRIGAVNTIFEVVPKEIIAGVHVRWTWWPGPPTTTALCKSIRQDPVTKYILQDVKDDIRYMWADTVLLEKCVHMPCSLCDRNDLILQLLQTQLVSNGSLYKNRSSDPLLADCKPQGALCRMECHKTTGLVKCFDSKHTLLLAVRHLAQCALLTRLRTSDIPSSFCCSH